jgi:hypothetical protein
LQADADAPIVLALVVDLPGKLIDRLQQNCSIGKVRRAFSNVVQH